MTNEEILEKAWEKAISGGYPAPHGGYSISAPDFIELLKLKLFAKALWGELVIGDGDDDNMDVEEYFKLIGSQKEWDGYNWGGPHFKGPIWKFHLQQMVIADDPIKYIGENI